MSIKIQYSPHPDAFGAFQTHPFAYSLEHASGRVITTMNRVRGFLETLGIIAPSKNIILAILEQTGGQIIGKAINTYGHISSVCVLHVENVKKRVEKALQNRELSNVIGKEQTSRGILEKIIIKSKREGHKSPELLPDSTQFQELQV